MRSPTRCEATWRRLSWGVESRLRYKMLVRGSLLGKKWAARPSCFCQFDLIIDHSAVHHEWSTITWTALGTSTIVVMSEHPSLISTGQMPL